MARLLSILLLVCLNTCCCYAVSTVKPLVDCPKYRIEGEHLICHCRAPKTAVKWTKLSWGEHSDGEVLKVEDIRRDDHGKQFTCQMHLDDGNISETIYTLQVAYGPSRGGVNVSGTGSSPFLADGEQRMTLTCEATDVNPPPLFSWAGVTCENGNKERNCTFTPQAYHDNKTVQCWVTRSPDIIPMISVSAEFHLDLNYPPQTPPELSGYTANRTIQSGGKLRCTVEGGKPLVSKVNIHCGDVAYSAELDERGNTSVSRIVVIDTSRHMADLDSVSCNCSAVWDVDPKMYTFTDFQNVSVEGGASRTDPPSSQHFISETSPAQTGGICAASVLVVIIIIAVVVFLVRRRNRGKETGKGGSLSESRLLSNDSLTTSPSQASGLSPQESSTNTSQLDEESGYTSAGVSRRLSSTADGEDQPTLCIVSDTSGYAIVPVTGIPAASSTPSAKPVKILKEGSNGYSEVQLDETSAPDDLPKSFNPYEVVGDIETDLSAAPTFSIPSNPDDSRVLGPELQRSKGPLGDEYTLVNKTPKVDVSFKDMDDATTVATKQADEPDLNSCTSNHTPTKLSDADGKVMKCQPTEEDGDYDVLDHNRHHQNTEEQDENAYNHI